MQRPRQRSVAQSVRQSRAPRKRMIASPQVGHPAAMHERRRAASSGKLASPAANRRVALEPRDERADRGHARPPEAGQARDVRVHELRELPHPRPALRRQAVQYWHLLATLTARSPLKSEAPLCLGTPGRRGGAARLAYSIAPSTRAHGLIGTTGEHLQKSRQPFAGVEVVELPNVALHAQRSTLFALP